MKRHVTMLLVLALAFSLCSGFAVTGFAEDGGNKLHIITRNIGSAIDSNNDTFKAIEEATGLEIEWELKPGENYAQLCQIIIASGEYPDAMEFSCSTYPNDLQMLADDGVVMPVDDLVAEYGQNIPQYRRESDWFTSTTDGLHYGIPCRTVEFGLNDYFLIRQDWLNALGLKVPETYQEFYDVLSAMKDNGERLVGEGNDFIPLGLFSGFLPNLMKWLGSECGYVRD